MRHLLKTGLGAACLGCVLAVPNVAFGQVVTGRTTNMNWHALYGGGPTIFDVGDSLADTVLEQSDSNSMAFSDSQTGTFPLPWTANVAIDFGQTYSVTGPLSNFSSISQNMGGSKSQSASGIGAAGIDSAIPGNRLYIDFDVASSMNYNFAGAVFFEINGAQVNSFMTLAKFNGSSYSSLIDSRQMGLGNNFTFDISGTLGAGSYRLVAQTEIPGGPSTYNVGNSYTFTNTDAVPEPTTLAVIGVAALVGGLRRKA